MVISVTMAISVAMLISVVCSKPTSSPKAPVVRKKEDRKWAGQASKGDEKTLNYSKDESEGGAQQVDVSVHVTVYLSVQFIDACMPTNVYCMFYECYFCVHVCVCVYVVYLPRGPWLEQ